MATIFAHAFVGVTIARSVTKKPDPSLIFWCALSTIVPDLDVIAFKFDIPYGDVFGHRGFTHSILFGFLWSALILIIFFRNQNKSLSFISLFFSTISHGLLDALTNGGLGVAFFVPFDNSRYFFPYRPIEVSPIGAKNFFSARGLEVILSEGYWIFLPCVAILIALTLRRYLVRR